MTARHVFALYDHTAPPGGDFVYCPVCRATLSARESGSRLRPACPACGFVQYRNPAPTVSILITDGGRVLLGKRAGEPGKGIWALPSGYIEYDEDFVTTAVREAKEETGLDIVVRAVINVASSFISSRFHFLGIYVAADIVGGELCAGDDAQEVAWFPLGEPLPALMFRADVCAIELYANGLTGLPVGVDP